MGFAPALSGRQPGGRALWGHGTQGPAALHWSGMAWRGVSRFAVHQVALQAQMEMAYDGADR